jgi:hypothetical protein
MVQYASFAALVTQSNLFVVEQIAVFAVVQTFFDVLRTAISAVSSLPVRVIGRLSTR